MRATTNPGGRGHHWVKKMFIDPAPYNKAYDATDIETGETLRYPAGHSKAGKPLFKRRFIPARLSDNPYLSEHVITGMVLTAVLFGSLSHRLSKSLCTGNCMCQKS